VAALKRSYVEEIKHMSKERQTPKQIAPVSAPPVPIEQVAATFGACTDLFFAMGDPTRQRIIMLLAQTEELNVNTITEQLPLSRPAISHHLKILRQAGLISVRRSGTEHFYALAIDDALTLLKRFVHEVENCE
jgi:ArsR family transcriptional regulator, arsenate/arsenite/antimonite-responsive transcriptional repressor